MKLICKECGVGVDSLLSLKRHLKKHRIKYYDYYIKHNPKEYCACGKEAKFVGDRYVNYCCRACYTKTPTGIAQYEAIKESFKTRDLTSWMDKRKKTNLKKYGVEHLSQLPDHYEKAKASSIARYGEVKDFTNFKQLEKGLSAYYEQIDIINSVREEKRTPETLELAKQKRVETCLDRYGVDSVSKLDSTISAMRTTRESDGSWMKIEDMPEFKKYSLKVKALSAPHFKALFEKWDGTDYYTGEKLVSNEEFKKYNPDKITSKNPLQPTVDHKISRHYGFMNGMTEEEIASVENLCICGRRTNSAKNYRCEEEFRKCL